MAEKTPQKNLPIVEWRGVLLATFSQRSFSFSSAFELFTVTDTAIEINPFVKLSTSFFIF